MFQLTSQQQQFDTIYTIPFMRLVDFESIEFNNNKVLVVHRFFS